MQETLLKLAKEILGRKLTSSTFALYIDVARRVVVADRITLSDFDKIDWTKKAFGYPSKFKVPCERGWFTLAHKTSYGGPLPRIMSWYTPTEISRKLLLAWMEAGLNRETIKPFIRG